MEEQSSELTIPRGRGRPPKFTEECVRNIESILRLGGSITAACAFAEVTTQAFYDHYKEEDGVFAKRVEKAKQFAIIASRQLIVKAIVEKDDLETAKWFIEKHDIKQGGVTQNTQVNVFQTLRDQYTKKNKDLDVIKGAVNTTHLEEAKELLEEKAQQNKERVAPATQARMEQRKAEAPKIELPKLTKINIGPVEDDTDNIY